MLKAMLSRGKSITFSEPPATVWLSVLPISAIGCVFMSPGVQPNLQKKECSPTGVTPTGEHFVFLTKQQ